MEKCKNITELNEREIFWIKKFNSRKPNGYNVLPGGGNYKRQPLKNVQTYHRNFIKIKFVDCNESEQVRELKEENENLRQLLLVAQSKLIKVQEELNNNQKTLYDSEKKFLVAESQSKDSQNELKLEQALHEVTKQQVSDVKAQLSDTKGELFEAKTQLSNAESQLEQIKKRGLFDLQ